LALGNAHSCGLTTDGNVQCWGDNSDEQSKDIADMTYITAGYQTTCGIKIDGTASCWGKTEKAYGYLTSIDFALQSSPDREDYIFCGLKVNNTLSYPSINSVPSGIFNYVTVGGHFYAERKCYTSYCSHRYYEFQGFACGIRENGLVACWGENYKERATAPIGIKIMQPENVIPVLPPITQEDLNNAYATGKQEGIEICKSNPASCDITTSSNISAIISQDLSLHVSKATYETLISSSTIWVDLIFDGANEEGNLTWILDKYGVVE